MPEWTCQAIILSVRKQGEASLLISLLTERHGRYRGLVRGGLNSSRRGAYEPGSRVEVAWRARLEEHLGHFIVEGGQSLTALLLDDPLRLACLDAAAALADVSLVERVPHPGAYQAFGLLLDQLGRDQDYATAHLHFELDLLADLGFGLDLGACAVSGATRDLAWVSPNTGRAVSAGAGAPYRDRLLCLPACLGGPDRGLSAVEDVAVGLKLTAHFLDRHVLLPRGLALPAARLRYVDRITRLVALSRSAKPDRT